MQPLSPFREEGSRGRTAWAGPVLLCLFLLGTLPVPLAGQVTVRTLGGGRLISHGPDAGFVDGNTLQESQFNVPSGLALDNSGRLFLADRNNGALRRLDLSASRSSTVLTGLDQPVAVAVNATNTVFVLAHGDGVIHRLDRFGNPGIVATGLDQPTAFALAPDGSLYVTQLSGSVVRVHSGTGAAETVVAGLNQPGGIALLNNGLLAVSETGAHRVRFIDPLTGQTSLLIGSETPGFRNGPSEIALFNQPHQLAPAPNGGIVVADRLNHRVRLIAPDGIVTTVYGVDPALWEGPQCITCNPMILPGWFDGNAEFAEARDPVGVAVSPSGQLYTSEVFYHVVREVTGLQQLIEDPVGEQLLPPVITPDSGYYPMGHNIMVFDPNHDPLNVGVIYYTTDGTDPGTNSLRVTMSDNVGIIPWRESLRDLTSLRVRTFVGNRASETIGGQPVEQNQIGITRDVLAGPGSTVVVPIVVNLRPDEELRSLQFRVEVTPLTAGAPVIPEDFKPLSVSTNDFVPVVTSSQEGGVTLFEYGEYLLGDDTRGLAVTFIGTNSNLHVTDFAVVTMLAVPVPPSARFGDRYSIEILRPSGTADAMEQNVPLTPMAPREIQVGEVRYGAGDSSPATWYNADSFSERLGFGDGDLNNSDVNNAFAASLGLRVPYPFTDLFDSMDVYPEDLPGVAGGDGLIRFLDWQLILVRSLGLDLSSWERSWDTDGQRTARPLTSNGLMNQPAHILTLASPPPGQVWVRQALIGASPVEHAQPGQLTDIPVFVQVTSGSQLAGLAFRATIEAEGAAPPVQAALQFVPAQNKPAPSQVLNPAPHVILCGWPLVPSAAFQPPLQGYHLLGHIRFAVPHTAPARSVYRVWFAHADGSPDLQTQYDFETRPGSVFVQSQALFPQDLISPEWKEHFFGDLHHPDAAPGADPDLDGVPNWAEYASGTDPLDGLSRLHLNPPVWDEARGGMVLRWLSAPGVSYLLESSATLLDPVWSPLGPALLGTGEVLEYVHHTTGGIPQFYRIRVQP